MNEEAQGLYEADENEVARVWQLLIEQGVEWGATGPHPDETHVEQFRDSLRRTREHNNLGDGPRYLHGVYLTGTEIVVCHTGISPNSQGTARLISGLLKKTKQLATDNVRLKDQVGKLKNALALSELPTTAAPM